MTVSGTGFEGTPLVCVYCGSSSGHDVKYASAARAMGRAIAARGCGLVYGGAQVGLMGVVADTVLEAGRPAVGVLPEKLSSHEIAHDGLSELVVVESMHERKALMLERACALVALPGGLGTLDELFEAWTWRQLGYHDLPIGLLNVDGYYDGLLASIAAFSDAGFVRDEHRDLVCSSSDSAHLLTTLLPETSEALP